MARDSGLAPASVAAPPPKVVAPLGQTSRFSVGDRVTVSVRFPVGHYRVPNYVRGKLGTIEQVISPRAVNNEEEGFGRNAGSSRILLPCCNPVDLALDGLCRVPRSRTAHRDIRDMAGAGLNMHPHQSDHDHDDLSFPAREASGYYEIMETAVRELLVETTVDRPRRDPPPDRGPGFPHAGAWRQSRRARLGRSGVPGAAARQRARGLRGARHQLLRRHRADRPREHRQGAQPHRLHAVLLLSAAGAGSAAGLVQAEALSGARGD